MLQDILTGKVPEIQFKASLDDKTIIKIAVAAVMVAVIIILTNSLFKK